MSDPTRTALVTGAASGIGAAIARALAAAGMRVICADLDGGAAADLARALGGGASALSVDIAEPGDAFAGIQSLDVLVNCAGVSDTTPTAELDMPGFRRVLGVNLDGTLAVTLLLLPLLRASATGRILMIASIQGFRGTPDSLAYATSKGGLVNLTRALATDVAADSVMVNALAPGFIDTPMARLPDGSTEYETDWFASVYVEHGRIPLRRPGTAEEVAAAAMFFVSVENTYVTGQVLAVDGGMTATF